MTDKSDGQRQRACGRTRSADSSISMIDAPEAHAVPRRSRRRRADRRSSSRRGPGRAKLVDRRLGPGRPDRRDLRGAGQPRADRPRGLGAGRPADDHQRRRELPGLPGRHPGPRPDGRVPRPGRALRDARSSTSTSTGSTSPSDRSGSGRAASSTAPSRSIVATGASALWLGPRQRDAPARTRRLGLRDLRRLLLPRQRDRGRRRRRHGPRGGDLPHPLRDARSTCSTAATRSGRRRS